MLISGLLLVIAQQMLRMGANDPQIQMAEDAGAKLSDGAGLSVLPASLVDVSHSLAPFLIVYDDSGAIVGSSAMLKEQTPALPSGVPEFVRAHGQDRITWQLASGVRIAAVIERFVVPSSGFVLAGRSLREVEKRESIVQGLVLAGPGVTLVGTLIIGVVCDFLLDESGARKNPAGGLTHIRAMGSRPCDLRTA